MGNVVEITREMNDCRDSARFVLGDRYPLVMLTQSQVLKAYAVGKGMPFLTAVQDLATGLDGMGLLLLLLAGAVEVMDPSDPQEAGEREGLRQAS